ncbi:MAG: oligosaccharide flippase family protein [Dysgonamonadaceae bacterium]|jgi:O-antigen/teichoic acid export membrane protein|nr:oligosaccharide flippase family protein [Dysgonamonadaceae bacterium]
MAGTKTLAKDSVIYGGTTIITRFISYLLTPLFTYTILPAEFGMMTHIYAWAAVIMIILTFGVETGFFRFVNRSPREKRNEVYSASLVIVGALIAVFLFVVLTFLKEIRPFLWPDDIPDLYLRLAVIIPSIDAFISVPFAFLRYEKKPLRFGFCKIIQSVLYLLFCIFFLLVCPWLNKNYPGLISRFWREDFHVGYILTANLIATAIQAVVLFSQTSRFRFSFSASVFRPMIKYCFPLMLMGLAGISNQVVDKIIFPLVFPGTVEGANEQLGLYSACFKIGVIMMVFTQAFRYAFDPFVFEKSGDKDDRKSYSVATKYFVILGLLVFLGVMFYLDIFKYFVAPEYWSALGVVPIVLVGELFFAVYYNLSIWYKLTDKTWWGTVFSVIGFVVIISLNIIFIPKFGYMACAWASFAGNLLMMLLSYFIGQKNYYIAYDLKTMFIYSALAAALFAASIVFRFENIWLRMALNTVLVGIYLSFMLRRDLSVKDLPFVSRILK